MQNGDYYKNIVLDSLQKVTIIKKEEEREKGETNLDF